MYKKRNDQSEKAEIEKICKTHKGTFTNFSDGSFQCANVLDATIDFDLGKLSLRDSGSPSRLKGAD